MDFTFSQEQQMLLDTTRRFLQDQASFDIRHAQLHQPCDNAHPIWQGLKELGLLAVNTPAQFNGLGFGPVETMLIMQAVGESLLLAPYCASAVVATHLIDTLGSEAQRASWLPALAEGDCIAVLAHDERNTHHDRMAINAKAIKEGDQYRLQGHKCVVAHAMSADLFLVTAMLEEQLCVFGVPRAMPGLRLVPCPLADGTLAADVFLDDVILPASAMLAKEKTEEKDSEDTDAAAAVSAALDRGLAAVCAEAVGALDKLMAATTEYTRNRKQFGVAIGTFQALRHRMAEMLMHTEQARSMSYLAAVRCTDPDLAQRECALSAAKVIIGQACRFVAQQAVQLHGGMGVTDELNISHYFKRLMVIEMQFGSTDHHLQVFAANLA
jgi:alkylation response protein AidB-like acyl-CoA dehydrogenase